MTIQKITRPIIWLIGFCVALVAIYTAAFGIIDEIYQRSVTVAVSLILCILAYPLADQFNSRKTAVRISHWSIDFVLILIMILSIVWFASVYDELESGLYSFLTDDIIVGCGGLLVVIEMTRRCLVSPSLFLLF